MATALRIVDEEGPDALSLRALAQRLGSSTATLYRHFDSRAALLVEVVDRMLGEIDIDIDRAAELSWQDAIKSFANALFDLLRKHRRAAPLVGEHIPVGPNAMLQREGALRLFLLAGFSPVIAARAYSTVARHVLGFAMQLTADASSEHQEEADVAAYVHQLDADLFPATVAVADALPIPLEDEFAFGLQLIIAGLEAVRDNARD